MQQDLEPLWECDITLDHKVDGEDAMAFRANYRQSGENLPGDFDGDGDVDFADLLRLAQAHHQPLPFRVFNSIRNHKRPGWPLILSVSGSELTWWSARTTRDAMVAERTDRLVCANWGEEHPIYVSRWTSEAQREAGIAWHSDVLANARALNPRIKIGVYGLWPARAVAPAIKLSMGNVDASVKDWQSANDRNRVMIDAVDAIFPSAYFFDLTDPYHYARGMTLESLRVAGGKPVYTFLWPSVHNGAAASVRGQTVKVEQLRRAAQGVYDAGGHGFVMWGDYGSDDHPAVIAAATVAGEFHGRPRNS
jgi:hypothetical protein